MILSDSLLGVKIFDLMIRVDSKQNVGNISLKNSEIKLLITVGPKNNEEPMYLNRLSDFVTNSYGESWGLIL